MKSPKAAFRILVATLSITAIICLLAVAAGWFYVFQMSDQVSILDTEVLNMRRQSSQLSELSIRYQKVLPQKAAVYGSIPTLKDQSTFMADMETAAKTNNLKITSTVVGNSQTKAAKTGNFSQTVNKAEYYELPIRYEIMGQYADFTKFIADLSSLRRLNSVNDVSVTADFSSKTTTGKVKAVFNVVTFAKK